MTVKQDPEMYARLRKPVASEEAARAAHEVFLSELGTLRERLGIPEVMCVLASYIDAEKGRVVCSAVGLGSSADRSSVRGAQLSTAPPPLVGFAGEHHRGIWMAGGNSSARNANGYDAARPNDRKRPEATSRCRILNDPVRIGVTHPDRGQRLPLLGARARVAVGPVTVA